MKLSRLFLVMALPVIAVGAAFGHTMPGHAPYDGLISVDPGGMPIVPGALHINAGAGYWSATKEFDDDGNSDPKNAEPNALLVPLDIGYTFNEHYMADITLQILRPSKTLIEVDPQTRIETKKTVNNMGLGDIWVKARGLWESATDLYLGPRLAVKVPVGTVDYESEKPNLGDDQMDIDVALVAGKYGESTMFKMSGQAGVRYRMKRTVPMTYQDPAQQAPFKGDVEVTPGVMFYLHAEPGIGTGSDQAFQIYVPIGYEMSMKDDNAYPADWPTTAKTEGVNHSSLYLGLYPKYQLDERNAIGLKFLYPVMGNNTPQGMYFTLTY
ncbi:MAG TPA: hypothetical protein VMW93_00975, partial [bacterium]|nr:hypothetical protein [bacterium]